MYEKGENKIEVIGKEGEDEVYVNVELVDNIYRKDLGYFGLEGFLD